MFIRTVEAIYNNMRYKVLICFLIFVNSSVHCYKPGCSIWCCNDKKQHQEELDKYEKCKISCYARSKRSIEDGINGPHIGESGLPLLEYGGDSFSHVGHPSPKPIVSVTTTTTTTASTTTTTTTTNYYYSKYY
ncbi:SWPV2-ORF068 [Shearwaterpox virus]|uniref:SWPV2-ORF068 n=1 Tax=Shearwaterpox virus TaxID=1974596 RepID=A0A1V0QG27_CNPV|nr:SWPV2-ORF068 [Shearwaterpox virus]